MKSKEKTLQFLKFVLSFRWREWVEAAIGRPRPAPSPCQITLPAKRKNEPKGSIKTIPRESVKGFLRNRSRGS